MADNIQLIPNEETNKEEEIIEVIEGTTEFQMKVTQVKPIHDRRLYGEVRFSFHGNQQYNPGDYVVIRPKNSAEDVEKLCQIYKLSKEELELNYEFPFSTTEKPQLLDIHNIGNGKVLRFPNSISLKDIFYEELDLSGPPTFDFITSPTVFASLDSEMLQNVTDKTTYARWIQNCKPNLITLLSSMTTPVPLDYVVHNGHLIQPRCYMAASARKAAVSIFYERSYIDDNISSVDKVNPLEEPAEVEMELSSTKPLRSGLCFNFLQNLKEGDIVNAVLCKGAGLIPPDPDRRLVLFAGGIGIGALRAFLDQKRRKNLTGKQTVLVEIPSKPENSSLAVTTTLVQYGTEDRSISMTPLVLAKNGIFGVQTAHMLKNSQWPQLLPRLRSETDCHVYIMGSIDYCNNVRKVIGDILQMSDKQLTNVEWLFEERITTSLHPFHLHMANVGKGNV